jgi:hypothetical protein
MTYSPNNIILSQELKDDFLLLLVLENDIVFVFV